MKTKNVAATHSHGAKAPHDFAGVANEVSYSHSKNGKKAPPATANSVDKFVPLSAGLVPAKLGQKRQPISRLAPPDFAGGGEVK